MAPLIVWLVLRELKRSPLWLFGRIAPALAATAVMSLAVMLAQETFARDLPPLARLVVGAAVGACVFVLAAWFALGRRPPQGLQGGRNDAVPDVTAAALTRRQPRVDQHLQVVRHGWLREAERLGQVVAMRVGLQHRRVAVADRVFDQPVLP